MYISEKCENVIFMTCFHSSIENEVDRISTFLFETVEFYFYFEFYKNKTQQVRKEMLKFNRLNFLLGRSTHIHILGHNKSNNSSIKSEIQKWHRNYLVPLFTCLNIEIEPRNVYHCYLNNICKIYTFTYIIYIYIAR